MDVYGIAVLSRRYKLECGQFANDHWSGGLMAARSNSRRRARSGIPIRFSLLAPEEGALLEPASATEAPRSLKTSEIVAQRIVEDIVAGNMQIGDKLPPESEMVDGYGVSRESVREGLRLLEVQGLITL